MPRSKPTAQVVLVYIVVLLVTIGGFLSLSFVSNSGGQDSPYIDLGNPLPTASLLPTDEPLWQPGAQTPLASSANYSGIKNLAVSLSYPLYGDGSEVHAAAFTGGGRIDRQLASQAYSDAKLQANRIAESVNNPMPPLFTRNFADCGAFVATIIINTIDPQYPGLFVYRQLEYLQDPKNDWIRVSSKGSESYDQLKPGDVFIAVQEGEADHTWLWLGEVNGQRNIIAQASYGSEGSSTAHLPALKINPLRDGQPDSWGRYYDVWRYSPAQP